MDPVDEAISKARMALNSTDPVYILEHLVEESGGPFVRGHALIGRIKLKA